MKSINSILGIILLLAVTAESQGQRQAVNDKIITVDVTKSYSPKRELILQDFMDVEYIALETNDDFLNQGVVLDIGKNIILVKNQVNDGDIFVYNRTGKALRKINRKGQGGEEYNIISNIILDEDNEEMFVNDIIKTKIHVYDLYGKFKRSFNHKKDAGSLFYTDMFNYDKDNLICYDKHNVETPFLLISKLNGSITKEIKIPFNEKKLLSQSIRQGDYNYVHTPGQHYSILPFKGNWMLAEISSDTVYTFLPNYSLRPLIVRTPPIQSMYPEIMLIVRGFSDRYYFMEAIKNVYNVSTNEAFPRTFFMYDKQENAFWGYTIYNGDYSTKKEIYMNASVRTASPEIEALQKIEAYQLVEAYKKGELKDGKLKEIASKLDAEDNPVIMLVKHKK